MDRAIGNEDWIKNFSNCLITHLPKIKSDHRPLLLNLKPKFSLPRGRPFCFLVGWIEYSEFGKFVEDQWNFKGYMSESLSTLTDDLKEWNKSIFGHIISRKRKLLHKLSVIQKQMDISGTNLLATHEIELRQELEDVLRHEEILWK